MNGLRDSERTSPMWADWGTSMIIETRIDRIERRRDSGKIDVVYVITREGHSPRLAWINGEEFPRQDGETIHDLTDRALRQYRVRYQAKDNVSVLIMDCRR
jgi:hypothetical protein